MFLGVRKFNDHKKQNQRSHWVEVMSSPYQNYDKDYDKYSQNRDILVYCETYVIFLEYNFCKLYPPALALYMLVKNRHILFGLKVF